MLIPVLPPDGSNPATWAMIELQGEIETDMDGVERTEKLDVGTIEMVPGNVRLFALPMLAYNTTCILSGASLNAFALM